MNILEKLYAFYDEFDHGKGYIGFTEKGKPIPYFCLGKSDFPVVLVSYSIHAREYITTHLALEHVKDFYKKGKKGRVYFIPAVNIDGIEIALKEKPLYKANANRVDLNVNFDARWGEGKSNVFYPADENYVGEYPFSESESKALRDFTLYVRPDVTVSYHSKGEEIYWEFYQTGKKRERDYRLAQKLSESTGYPLKTAVGSAGGYKDWCIEKLGIPSFTIEVGKNSLTHPIKESELKDIYQKNKDVINVITENYNYER